MLTPDHNIKPSLPVLLFAHVPHPQRYSEAQILETVLHKGINLLREVFLPHVDYFKGKPEICRVYFFVCLSPLFELICQFQPNLTELEIAQNYVFVVFTPLFIQDNMNTIYKALENHISEFCCLQNCQKAFVTHLWLHYAKVRYFILAKKYFPLITFIFTWEISIAQRIYQVFLSVYKLCPYKQGANSLP